MAILVGAPSAAAGDELPAHVPSALAARAHAPSALDANASFLDRVIVDGPPPQTNRGAQIVSSPERPMSLRALSLTYQALNGLDWVTTVRALRNGHHEGNPMLAQVASNPTALLVAKGVSTVTTLYLLDRLGKRHRRTAIGAMVAVNVFMGAVVVHNAAVGGRRSRP